MFPRSGRVLGGAVAALTLASITFTAFGSTVGAVPGAAAKSVGSQARTSTHKVTNVHFFLNWLPNVEFAGLWVADQKGWWKKAGIKMTYTPWAPGKEPTTDAPAYNGIAFGFQSGAAIAIARSKGVPITALYTDTQRSVFGLTVLKKSHITKLSQLRGKRVGYQSDEFYVPATMLSCAGLSETDWRPVQVGFDITALTSGHVDAYLTFVTNEPITLKLKHIPATTFPAYQHCFHFYDDVMFAPNSLISKNPQLVRKVESIAARGFAWAHSHPVAAAKLTVAHYFPASKGTSAAANLKQQTLELQTFGPYSRDAKGHYSGLMKTSYWRDSINTLYKYKEITSKPNPATIYTNKFNPNK